MTRHWLPAVLALAVLAGTQTSLCAFDRDLLRDTRDRMKIEAQRVEKLFAEERAAAYRLVRSDNPKLVEATDKLYALLAVIEKDTSLDSNRRDLLLVTIKADLTRVKNIAGERRRASIDSSYRADRRDEHRRPFSEPRRPRYTGDSSDRRTPYDVARKIVKGYGRDVADSSYERRKKDEAFGRVMKSVDKSATTDGRDYKLPADWRTKMMRRGSDSIKMTAREKAIMAALRTTLDVDFTANTFEEVIDWLRKKSGVEIVVDKRGLDMAGVKYETQITKRMRSSMRSVLKSILGDLGLAYIVKDEAIQVLSIEQARQATTTRVYYVGDLATTVDVRIPPALSQLMAIQTINQIIQLITSNYDPKSWQVNNPEAPGSIVFDPIRMSLIVKQTAEFHFLYAGK